MGWDCVFVIKARIDRNYWPTICKHKQPIEVWRSLLWYAFKFHVKVSNQKSKKKFHVQGETYPSNSSRKTKYKPFLKLLVIQTIFCCFYSIIIFTDPRAWIYLQQDDSFKQPTHFRVTAGFSSIHNLIWYSYHNPTEGQLVIFFFSSVIRLGSPPSTLHCLRVILLGQVWNFSFFGLSKPSPDPWLIIS